MNLVARIIVACEIALWVLLGPITRYIFNSKKTCFFILAMTPVTNLVLIKVTGIDIYIMEQLQ